MFWLSAQAEAAVGHVVVVAVLAVAFPLLECI
jgi:hypothetical protein